MAASKPIILLSFYILIAILSFASVGSVAISSSNNPDVVAAQMYNGRKLLGISSPPVTASTRAILTLNGFAKNEDGGGKSECDEQFHKNTELIVALSTGWYAGGARCGKKIKIKSGNGKTALAKVVDECDSRRGCNNNIVDASHAVWEALGLNEDEGRVAITWSMA